MAAPAVEGGLKYLEFVVTAALRAIMCLLKFYSFAKGLAGPLKFGVEAMEGTVKAVVGPLFNKFNAVPLNVLKFVDRKVDESATKIGGLVPETVKQVSSQAVSAVLQAPEVARNVVSDIQRKGLKDAASGIVKSVAEQSAASAWHTLNQLPVFPAVAQAVLPTAALCTEKYNETAQISAKKGGMFSSFLPLFPTESFTKVLRPKQN